MNKKLEFAKNLIEFIYASPSSFHVVESARHILNLNGFVELKEEERWEIQKGGRYYVAQSGSAIVSFVVGTGIVSKRGFKIIGAHTDSPTFKIKPAPELVSEGAYIKLNTEVYGGPILNTWLDRPLSIAGRVVLKSHNVLFPETRLLNIKRPIAIIPNLAIHMNRMVNKGIELNTQKDTLPLLGLINEQFEKENYLLKLIAEELKVTVEDILDFDLYLYEFEKGCIMGVNNEFISSSRLDDLQMVHAGINALVNVKAAEATNVIACFDNEEVGSSTKQGADSQMLANILERIVIAFGGDRQDYFRALSKSFIVSADGAHAVHPSSGEKSDPTNRPIINKGAVIKVSASQSYTSDGVSSAVYEQICKGANIPFQKFVNRSDEKGGSTIGPISSTHIGIRSVDIGIALLAMHSIRELCGVNDHSYIEKSFEEFYKI